MNSSGNLREDICTLRIVGGVISTGDMVHDILHCLRCLDESTLLVIDNLNSIPHHEEEIWAMIQQCGCRLLVTTRCQVPMPDRKQNLELGVISSTKSLISLVSKISGRKDLDTAILKKLFARLHAHTTAVILIAALLRTGRYSPKEILEKLKDFIKERLHFANIRDSFYGHLRTLFGLFHFEGLERYALENMVLVPRNGIPLNLFEAWAELTDADILNTLIDAGLVYAETDGDANNYRYMVSLKPIVRELAQEELTPSFQSCAKLIHNTAVVMGLLMDNQDTQYLMQLSMEVIKEAQKDDIPVYIDYLHKSFELAARNNQKTDMQQIADALAEVLTETSYGTNLDRALMQDYQATVQDNVEHAIAYRKEAITHLDPEIPAEKQLTAEILDRIAGDCLVNDNWMRAKPYSDLSWSMFQDLGLLGKTATFHTACRRGVILCHTGSVTEGLALLHEVENFIKNHELNPTQNRISVQAALLEAYTTAGNLEEAEKYEKLYKESFDSLYKIMKSNT